MIGPPGIGGGTAQLFFIDAVIVAYGIYDFVRNYR
jgi:hypothetical protein